MFNWNNTHGLLEISKLPIQYVGNVYEDCDAYKSYKKYIEETVLDDIVNVLIPNVNEILGGTSRLPLVWVERIRVVDDPYSSHRDFMHKAVYVSLGSMSAIDGGKEFCIFKLPNMEATSGYLQREDKRYALINHHVLDDEVVYDGKILKVMLARDKFELTNEAVKEYKFHLYRGDKLKKIPVTNLIAALALKEGRDPEALLKESTAAKFFDQLADEDKVQEIIQFGVYDEDIRTYIEILESKPKYSALKVRNRLNQVLSLTRALNKELSRDIVLSDRTIERGTQITQGILDLLNKEKVNCVYVRRLPKREGYFLARTVLISTLRRGTEVVPAFKPFVGDYPYGYLDHDMKVENSVVLWEDTPITNALLEALEYNGISSISIKEKLGTSKVEEISFESDIIGNMHFQDDDESYFYLDGEGNKQPPSPTLTAYDILGMVSLMSSLESSDELEEDSVEYKEGRPVSGDLNLRKRLKMANEQFREAFALAAPEFCKKFKSRFNAEYKASSAMLTDSATLEMLFYPFEKMWWKRLTDHVKCIAQLGLTNPAAFNASVTQVKTKVSNTNSVSLSLRQLTMGHYGRLCPYAAPQSKRIGIANNLALGCKLIDGLMYTSYRKLEHRGDEIFLSETIEYFSVYDEEKYNIADITSLEFSKDGKVLTTGRVPARIPSHEEEHMTFANIDIKYVHYVNADPNQSLGSTAALIPFVGANDSARVTFGQGMITQAKVLQKPDIPYVMTSSYINMLKKNKYYEIHAEYDGEVIEKANEMLVVYYPSINKSVMYTYKSCDLNIDSVIVRNAIVTEGDIVKAGQLLVKSNVSVDGVLAIGVNALVAFIPVGYNYEDGVLYSQRLSSKLTSYGAHKDSHKIKKSFRDPVIRHVSYKKYLSVGETVCDVSYRDKSNNNITMPLKGIRCKGYIHSATRDMDTFKKQAKNVSITSVSLDPLAVGSKLTNRHGNKGVTSNSEPNANMPYFSNGEFVDIEYNPNGVTSRMNIGQILECNLQFACHVLGIHVVSDSFNGASTAEVQLMLNYAYDIANEDDTASVNKRYPMLPKELHEHVQANIAWIKNWKDTFTRKGEAYLVNPVTGKYFESPVLVGVNYVLRLTHESSSKINARGGYLTEEYVVKSARPPSGIGARGGQRIGSMELDALSAYGAAALTHELLNERGDNSIARNNLTAHAVTGTNDYSIDESLAIRRSTLSFLAKMEGLGVHIEIDELPGLTDSINGHYFTQEYLNRIEPLSAQESHSTVGKIGVNKLTDYLKGGL